MFTTNSSVRIPLVIWLKETHSAITDSSERLMTALFPEVLHIDNPVCPLKFTFSLTAYKVPRPHFILIEHHKYITLFSSGIRI